MGSLRVGHDWATSLSLFTFMRWRRQWQPTPVLLPGESQGRGSLVGCRLWGRRVGHNWGDLAAAAGAKEQWDANLKVWKHFLEFIPLRGPWNLLALCICRAQDSWVWKTVNASGKVQTDSTNFLSYWKCSGEKTCARAIQWNSTQQWEWPPIS